MSHAELKQKIFLLVDAAELAEEERRALQTHAETCAECRRALERWRGASAALFNKAPVQAPWGFTGRVMARLENLGSRPEAGLWWRNLRWEIPVLAMTAAALFLVFGTPRLGPSAPTVTVLLSSVAEEEPVSWVSPTATVEEISGVMEDI